MEIANVGMVLVGMLPVGILLVRIGTAPTEPGRQTVFGAFQAKNLASGSNDLQELFRK